MSADDKLQLAETIAPDHIHDRAEQYRRLQLPIKSGVLASDNVCDLVQRNM
jgi:hypothetical protein